MIHVYCDGSHMPGTKHAGYGCVATVAHDRAICWAAPCAASTSMDAELAAAQAACAWLRPGTTAVLVVDNEATARRLRPAWYAHLTALHVTWQPHATTWPAQRAHELAQAGAAGHVVAPYAVQRRGMPRAVITLRPQGVEP